MKGLTYLKLENKCDIIKLQFEINLNMVLLRY